MPAEKTHDTALRLPSEIPHCRSPWIGILRGLANGLGGNAAATLARAIWQQAGSFQIRREEPVWTQRGKLPHLRSESRLRDQDAVQSVSR